MANTNKDVIREGGKQESSSDEVAPQDLVHRMQVMFQSNQQSQSVEVDTAEGTAGKQSLQGTAGKQTLLSSQYNGKKTPDHTMSTNHGTQAVRQYINNIVQCESLQGADNTAAYSHEHCKQVIQKDARIYIETRKLAEAAEILKSSHHVTIIGPAGSGKTAMAYHLLREYERRGFVIMFAKTPQELKRNRNPHVPTILLINDIFGRSVFSPTQFYEWKDVLEEIEPLLGYATKYTNKCKLICTSRNYIWSEAFSSLGAFTKTLFSENTIIDITDGLSFEEKKYILNIHERKNHYEMPKDIVERICKVNSPHGFPHTCFLFFKCKQFHDKEVGFFERPLPCLLESIQDLAERDQEKYAILVLVLLHNGELKISSLTSNNQHLDYMRSLFPKINFDSVARNINIISTHLCSSFLKRENGILMFHHPTIQDTVAYLLGKSDPEFIIGNCSAEFLYERVRISDKETDVYNVEDTYWFRISIPYEMWSSLSVRFATEIKNKNLPLICSHPAMSNPEFVRRCFANLTDEDLDLARVEDITFSRSILTWTMWSKSDVLCEYLISNFKFKETKILKSVVCCCSSGNDGCMKLLIQRVSKAVLHSFKTKREQYEYIVSDNSENFIRREVQQSCCQDSLILLACEFGHKKIIELLLREGEFSIHDVNDNGDGVLHKCCSGENAALVPLLLKYGCDILAGDKTGNIPLHIASKHGNINHAHRLLEHEDKKYLESQILARNKESDTPLLLACKYGHEKMVKLLLENGAEIKDRNGEGHTAFILAKNSGHLGILNLLRHHPQYTSDSCSDSTSTINERQTRENYCHPAVEQRENSTIHLKDDIGDTSLMIACQNNELSIADNLPSCGEDVNAINKFGNTPLTTACENNNEEMVNFLLCNNASVNAVNSTGCTPLIIACQKGNEKIVHRLISLDVDTTARDHLGNTAFISACKSGNSSIVQRLLLMTNDAYEKNILGQTGFFLACKEGYFDIVKLLLEKNIDVNTPDNDGNSPLFEASANGHIRITDLLISKGANVHTRNKENDTALHIVCRKGYLNIAQTLVLKGAKSTSNIHGETPLLCAVKSGVLQLIAILIPSFTDDMAVGKCLHHLCSVNNEEGIRALLSNKEDLDWKDETETTPLMVACKKGLCDIAFLLLEAGTDVNMLNNTQETALMLACRGNYADIVELLVEDYKADVNVQNAENETALIISSRTGSTAIVQLVLTARPLMNLCNHEGNTALSVASHGGHLETVEKLLCQTLTINHRNKEGNTSLMQAARNGYIHIIKCLLNSDADSNIRNCDGDTALMMYIKGGYEEKIELLLSWCDDVDVTNTDGNTPLLLAVQENKSGAVTHLLQNGANINLNDKSGNSPLIWACRKGFDGVLDILINYKASLDKTRDGEDPLLLAVLSGNCTCAELVISELEHWDVDYTLLLHELCQSGKNDMIEVLLPWCELNGIDEKENTPLMSACRGGYVDTVQLFLKHTKDINQRNKKGDSPVFIACKGRHLLVVDVLLSHGADVTTKNNMDETTVMFAYKSRCKQLWSLLFSQFHQYGVESVAWQEVFLKACEEGDVATVKVFLQQGMSVNVDDIIGDSTLIIASKMNQIDVVTVLLLKGVDVNHCNHEGKPALYYTCRNGNISAVRTLLSHKADVTFTDADNDPLSAAIDGKHEDIAKQLVMYNPAIDRCLPALILACDIGSEDMVKLILANATFNHNVLAFVDTPLTNAARKGYLPIVKELITYGFNVNQYNKHGDTPLQLACANGHQSSVQVLLDNKADPSLTDSLGNNVLITACSNQHHSMVTILLSAIESAIDSPEYAAFINTKNDNGKTALIVATELEDELLINLLITDPKKLIHVDVQDSNGDTALMITCRKGNDGLVLQLLSVSADVNITNNDCQTPLITACMNFNVTVADILLQSKAGSNDQCCKGYSPLHWACKTGSLSMVTLLLKYSVIVDVVDNCNITPLMYACQSGEESLVNLLLQNSADFLCKDDSGHSVLWYAVSGGNRKVLRILIAKLQDTGEKACFSLFRSCLIDLLINACRLGNKDIVRELMIYEANVNTPNSQGETPLTVSSQQGWTDISDYLITSGAVVNMCNNSGDTSLMLACRESHESIVSLLLKYGAAVNTVNRSGTTALMFASMNKSQSVVLDLLSHGANVDFSNNEGDTALMAACQVGNLENAKILLNHHAKISVCNIHGQTPFSESLLYPELLKCLNQQKEKCNLFTACKKGNLYKVKNMLTFYSDIDVDLPNEDGHSPLLIACKAGHKDVLEFLLSLHCNVNFCDRDGNTALHFACKYNREGIPTILLRHGANVDIKNDEGQTAYMIARQWGKDNIADELLPTHLQIEDNVFAASRKGDLQHLKDLLRQGHKTNETNQFGETPLMLAFWNRNTAIIEFLMSNSDFVDSVTQHGDTVLMYACKGGDCHMVKKSFSVKEKLKLDIDKNKTSFSGITPLMVASIYGYKSIVKLLLQKGVNLNMVDKKGNTALLFSCRYGHWKVAKLLTKFKALTHCNKVGNTPLHEACNGGHLKMVEVLLSQNADVNIQNANGDTALHIASGRGYTEIVVRLLKCKQDINHCNFRGCTALMQACQSGHRDTERVLTNHGADTDIRNELGKTCFQLAIENGYMETDEIPIYDDAFNKQHIYDSITDLQVDKTVVTGNSIDYSRQSVQDGHQDSDTDGNRFILACKSENKDIVSQLLSTGSDVNVVDENGDTALVIVCRMGDAEIAEILLNNGAPVNVSNKYGETPLMVACKNNCKDIVELLLLQANVNVKNNMGYTALMCASVSGNTELTELLLAQGADANLVNIYGKNAFMLAEMKGHSDIVELLTLHLPLHDRAISACFKGNRDSLLPIIKKVNINQMDSKGDTLLMIATRQGHLDIVNELIHYGADVNVRHDRKETALMIACRSGRDVIVNRLLFNGAFVNLQNDKGERALILACAGGHLNVVQQLLEHGADKCIESFDHESPLSVAKKAGHTDIVKFLSKKKRKGIFSFTKRKTLF